MALPFTGYTAPGQSVSYGTQYYTPQPQPLSCRPVSTKEEAASAQVPFDGTPYVFLNLPQGEIYVKQFDFNTGVTSFNAYAKQIPAPPPQFATQGDLERLTAEIQALKGMLSDESNANDTARQGRRKSAVNAAAVGEQ